MFRVEKNRQLIIAYLILNQSDYCTSEELAERTNLSSRTIKTEISVIASIFKENGAELISKKSDGYTYRILDEGEFRPFLDRVNLLYLYYQNQIDLFSFRKLTYIVRRILLSSHPVRTETLADELFISRGGIRKDLQAARSMMESYHLTVKNNGKDGIGWEGEEQWFRLCVMGVFGVTYHDFEKNFRNEDYTLLFKADAEEAKNIRKNMLQVLRELHFSVHDGKTQELAHYLVLTRNRIDQGNCISLPKELLVEAKELPSYPVACAIFKRNHVPFHGSVPEDEEAFLAIMLACYRDYCGDDVTEKNLGVAYSSAISAFEEVKKALLQQWSLKMDETTESAWLGMCGSFAMRSHFGFLGLKTLIVVQSASRINNSPMAVQVGSSIVSVLENRFGSNGNARDLYSISWIVYEMIHGMQFTMHKSKVAVVSALGKEAAGIIEHKVRTRYGDNIESMASYDLYELRGFNEEDLDVVIIDYPNCVYRYSWPVVKWLGFDRREALHTAGVNWFNKQVRIEPVLMRIENSMKVYRSMNVHDLESCYHILMYKHGYEEADWNSKAGGIREQDSLICDVNLAGLKTICLPYRAGDKETLEFYKLNTPIVLGEIFKVRALVYVSMDFSNDPDLIHALTILLESLCKEPNRLEEFLDLSCEERILAVREYILTEGV